LLAREINELAEALLEERKDEFLARAKASGVVQDELRRLQAKEEQKRQRQLERNSKHRSNSTSRGSQRLPLNESLAQNGAAK
jgi:hypothetical protein